MKIGRRVLVAAVLTMSLLSCSDIALKDIVAGKVAYSGGPPKVLVILQADYAQGQAGIKTLLNTLSAYSDIKSVDYVDGSVTTPSVAQLQRYAVVLMASDSAAADMPTLSDNLATYLDGGGRVVLATFDFSLGYVGGEIQGRLLSQYSPFQPFTSSLYLTSFLWSYTAAHPVMAGVANLTVYFRDGVALSTGATAIAYYFDGYPMVAEKGNVVAINAAIHLSNPDDPNGWVGDGWTLLHNAILYVAHK